MDTVAAEEASEAGEPGSTRHVRVSTALVRSGGARPRRSTASSSARSVIASFVLAGLSLVTDSARAENAPCKGCVLVPPRADAGPVPLLVTLHGDIDHADTTAAPWRAAIAERGWGLLSIECPVAEGCDKGSFWRWNGPVAWILAQVKKVTDAHPIDRDRLYVSGWSGGASYIGWHAHEISDAFAAIVIHGGGVKPRLTTCATHTPPVYFLVGSGNPLHDRVKDLHAFFEGCHHEVVWDLLPRKGHAEELAALDRRRADTILAQLETWSRKSVQTTASATSAPSMSAVSEPPSAPSVSSSAASPSSSAAPALAPSPSPKSARGCATSPRDAAHASDPVGAGLALVGVARIVSAARARRTRRAPNRSAAKLQ